jgi:hypothetical protein
MVVSEGSLNDFSMNDWWVFFVECLQIMLLTWFLISWSKLLLNPFLFLLLSYSDIFSGFFKNVVLLHLCWIYINLVFLNTKNNLILEKRILKFIHQNHKWWITALVNYEQLFVPPISLVRTDFYSKTSFIAFDIWSAKRGSPK